MLRGKERKKRKKEQIYKVKQRQMKFIYIKDYLQGEKNSGQSKQKTKCRNNNNRFLKLKLKKEERKKGKLHRTAKAQCRGRGL